MIYAIIPAAGSGSRAQLNKNKLLADLNGKSVIETTVGVFSRIKKIDGIILAASAADIPVFKDLFQADKKVRVVEGGKTRTESVKNALGTISGDGIVVIHDGARPFVSEDLILRSIECAEKFGSAVAAVQSVDTLARLSRDGLIESTTRADMLAVQTPQTFKTSLIKKAYAAAENQGFTDDAGVFCKYIGKAHAVEGERTNVKLTYKEDFERDIRVGTGFDLHRLTEGRKLILGGIEIPHVKGLLGHSDADVLAHAIMDALLSAASLRDIGYHFPDTDPQYKGISSMILFGRVMELLRKEGYAVNNISATIMAEKPKLKGYMPEITASIAAAADIPVESVGIGCTTLEGVGTVGREEGIAVQAYCSIRRAR